MGNGVFTRYCWTCFWFRWSCSVISKSERSEAVLTKGEAPSKGFETASELSSL